jgi:AraC-like DNA-binding protein
MIEIFDDIRQFYNFWKPTSELREYIEFYSETSIDSVEKSINHEQYSIKLFPSFTPTIWINLGHPYQLFNNNCVNQIGKSEDVIVLRNQALIREVTFNDKIFTIKFLPLGFEKLFGFSQSSLQHSYYDASDLLGKEVLRKLKAAENPLDKVAYLDAFFLEKLQKSTLSVRIETVLKNSLKTFEQGYFNSKISTIASSVYLTEKTFNRQFQKSIGTNPKKYFSVIRCRKALIAYQQNKIAFSPLDYGYFDWGHFSKDVKIFTGQSLTNLR